MTDHQTDEGVLQKIHALVGEEHALYGRSDLDGNDRDRLDKIRIQLDQAWDLLRQRRALREFGDDPDRAHERPVKIVENYEQ